MISFRLYLPVFFLVSNVFGANNSDLFPAFDEMPISLTKLLIIIVAMIAIFILSQFFISRKTSNSFLDSIPTGQTEGRREGVKEFLESNPLFKEALFLEKVDTAFIELRNARMTRDLSKVRRFISDGIWYWFTTRFQIMERLDQSEIFSRIRIHKSFIDSIESDGSEDSITVGVEVSYMKHIKCSDEESLENNRFKHFVEYLCFTRKKGVGENDIYSGNQCPDCNAPLKNSLNESAACPYCNALINSGKYDWVLSGITSAQEYSRSYLMEKKNKLKEQRLALSAQLCNCSVNEVLDIARNGFSQIIRSKSFNRPEMIRRFVSTELYEYKLEESILTCKELYNLFAVNNVSLLAAVINENYYEFWIDVSYSAQKMVQQDELFLIQDSVAHSMRDIIKVTRKADAASMGQLYMHSCPECNAPLQDNESTCCPYCKIQLNSPEHAWIITDIMTSSEYRDLIKNQEKGVTFAIDSGLVDSLLSVKEYAINNIIAMISCDGEIAGSEIEYLKKVAKLLRYRRSEISNIVKMARTGVHLIRMPDDMKQRNRIFALMEKAATADRRIAPEEAELLEFVKKTYLNTES